MSIGTTCVCGADLVFEERRGTVTCWCQRCEDRSKADDEGHAVLVYGYGKTNEAAVSDWNRSMESM